MRSGWHTSGRWDICDIANRVSSYPLVSGPRFDSRSYRGSPRYLSKKKAFSETLKSFFGLENMNDYLKNLVAGNFSST